MQIIDFRGKKNLEFLFSIIKIFISLRHSNILILENNNSNILILENRQFRYFNSGKQAFQIFYFWKTSISKKKFHRCPFRATVVRILQNKENILNGLKISGKPMDDDPNGVHQSKQKVGHMGVKGGSSLVNHLVD